MPQLSQLTEAITALLLNIANFAQAGPASTNDRCAYGQGGELVVDKLGW